MSGPVAKMGEGRTDFKILTGNRRTNLSFYFRSHIKQIEHQKDVEGKVIKYNYINEIYRNWFVTKYITYYSCKCCIVLQTNSYNL